MVSYLISVKFTEICIIMSRISKLNVKIVKYALITLENDEIYKMYMYYKINFMFTWHIFVCALYI